MPTERVEFLTKEIIELFPSEIEVSNIIVNHVRHYNTSSNHTVYKKNLFYFRLYGREHMAVNIVERPLLEEVC